MIVTNLKYTSLTQTMNGEISMSASEWAQFQRLTFAPWRPRTILEFNAMCDLASARHLHENEGGMGGINACAVQAMKFGPNGEVNFPVTPAQEAYTKKYGKWPTPEQLKDFIAGVEEPASARPKLTVVPGSA